MAAPNPKTIKIDLLLKKDLTQKSSGRFLLWALTVGRYIAIFTELVVIAGVIARFTLDYQRNKLSESILEQQTIIASYQDTEEKINKLFEQLKVLSSLDQNQLHPYEMINKISAFTPNDLRITDFTMTIEGLEIKGVALSPNGLSAFLSGIYSLEDFKDIVLKSLETGGPRDPSITFVLNVVLTDKPVQTTSKK
jgi:Tfp pilus assembly protein PilN